MLEVVEKNTAKANNSEPHFIETNVAEWLGLTPEESALIETRLALTRALREQRRKSGMTQTALAEKIGSSQSRIARTEKGDPQVSLDLLVRALFATGAGPAEVGAAIAGAAARAGVESGK